MRSSGILLPVFSLPGKYGIGCFSEEAYNFVDFLAEAGQTLWQILPLGPTSYGDSPYQSFSTFAGNPYYISLEELIARGLLTEKECRESGLEKSGDIDYGNLYEKRFALLRIAFKRADILKDKDFSDFVNREGDWLEDYALYMAVKASFDNKSFEEWDNDIRLRKPDAMERYREKYSEDILFYEYLQYEFEKEWSKLKKYANKKGVKIIGDIPIYVAPDSADVWANPSLFQLDKDFHPTRVAGCPPDAFTAKGQLWGNPLYNWDYHRKSGFAWWKKRIEKCTQLYDIIRIDHFRGFDQYYSIPAGAEDAVNGKWVDGPGISLFEALKPVLEENKTEIIAEDLGFITDSVKKLVKDTGFPNMKVIEFAFDPEDQGKTNDYLPFNYDKNCIAYTGTHDNETLLEWLKKCDRKTYSCAKEYAGVEHGSKKDVARALVRAVVASPANMAVIPLQDYLLLDKEARINTPSTLGGNWGWRVNKKFLTKENAKRIKKLTKTYGRNCKEKKAGKKDVEIIQKKKD